MTDVLFLSIAFGDLVLLAIVLVLVGRAAGDCPQIGGAARVATLVVTTGFAAIGTGVVLLIASTLPVLMQGEIMGLYVALGLVGIALGIGFYSAASALRDLLKTAPRPDSSDVEPAAA